MMSSEEMTYVCLYVARLCIILFIWATFRVFWEEVTPVPEKFEVDQDLDAELRRATPFRLGLPCLRDSSEQQMKLQKKILMKMAVKKQVKLLQEDRHGRLCFLETCVGLHNYKFYVQSVCYAELYILWISATATIGLGEFLYRESIRDHIPEILLALNIVAYSWMIWYYIIRASRFYHFKNVTQNKTSYERKYKPHFRGHAGARYDLGFVLNVQAVFGSGFWLIPLDSVQEDGIHYTISLAE